MKQPPDVILYVDDEEQALKYFRMTFAKDYEVLTAANAEAAWEIFTREADRLALVVSDHRMPGKQGVDLLTAMRERDSRVIRLLTTAYSELGSAIEAVNKGAVYAYITKPWKIDELRLTIRRAVEFRNLQRERDALLAEKLSVVQELLLADRLRGLALAASGLSGRVSSPFAAVVGWWKCPLRLPLAVRGDGRDAWPEVVGQARELAKLGCELAKRMAGIPASSTRVEMSALVKEATGLAADGGPVHITGDAGLLHAGLAALVRCLGSAAAHHGVGIEVRVSLSAGGGATMTFVSKAVGSPGGVGEGEADGLLAHLAIHHHGGSIDAGSWQAGTGQVVVRLPGTPVVSDDGLEALEALLAAHER